MTVEMMCGRCGSTLDYRRPCVWCEATGYTTDDPDPSCPRCEGTGRAPYCFSTPEWCEANPLPGCEEVARHTSTSLEVEA